MATRATTTAQEPKPVPQEPKPVPETAPAEAPADDDSITLINPGSSPVVYDPDGRRLEPGRRVTIKTYHRVARRAVERGYLVKL